MTMLPLDRDWLCHEPGGTIRYDGDRPRALLAGSFNPFHEGHRRLAETASRQLGVPVGFELSIQNVDKPALSAEEIRRRLDQFAGFAPVWLTRAPTFEMKARLFPQVILVVGSDTAERIVAPRYYPDGAAGRDRSLDVIRSQGCRFLVAGRTSATGKFLSLDDVPIPAALRNLFKAIHEREFRVDLSSTELRNRQGS